MFEVFSRDIRRATIKDISPLSNILARAFINENFHQWLFSTRRSVPIQRLQRYFKAHLRASIHDGVVYTTYDLKAVALWIHPLSKQASFYTRWVYPLDKFLLFGPRAKIIQSAFDLFYAKRPEAPHWYLEDLAVDPDSQGKGLSVKLLMPILDKCDRERTLAYLEVSSSRIISFYEKFGFHVDDFLFLPDGQVMTTMIRHPR